MALVRCAASARLQAATRTPESETQNSGPYGWHLDCSPWWMTRSVLGMLALAFAIGFGCSESTPVPDAEIEAVAAVANTPTVDPDCFEESCIEPWVDEPEYDPNAVAPEQPETTEDVTRTTEIGVPEPLDAGVLPDGGCVGQAEPQCPLAPPGTRPQNPGIPSGGQCRGACGKGCPASCRPGPTQSTCVEWQDAACQWHQKTCTYPTIECGTAQGCEDHDNCYDRCARGWRGIRCRRRCDAACVTRWGAVTCNKWRRGREPYDSWLQFSGAATSGPVYDTTCY